MKWIAIAVLLLQGCGAYRPCWYHGKAVSQHDANNMKRLGMDVKCPGDEGDPFKDIASCEKMDCGKKP